MWLGREDRAVGAHGKLWLPVLSLPLSEHFPRLTGARFMSPSTFTDFKRPEHTSDFITFLLLSKVQCFKWKDSSKGMA